MVFSKPFFTNTMFSQTLSQIGYQFMTRLTISLLIGTLVIPSIQFCTIIQIHIISHYCKRIFYLYLKDLQVLVYFASILETSNDDSGSDG